MPLELIKAVVRWSAVSGATSYEVKKDGVVVGSKGKDARTTTVNVDRDTVVEVTDLPGRTQVQSMKLTQEQS